MKRLAVALVAVLALAGCTAQQVKRVEAHAGNAITSTIFGAVGVAVGGLPGLAVAVGGILLGTTLDVAMQPPPDVVVKRVTTVIHELPPGPDGSPQPPQITSKVDDEPQRSGAPNPSLPPAHWYDRMWIAVQVVWWIVLGAFILGWLLTHPKVLRTLCGIVRFLAGFALHAVQWAWEKLRSKFPKTPPAGE